MRWLGYHISLSHRNTIISHLFLIVNTQRERSINESSHKLTVACGIEFYFEVPLVSKKCNSGLVIQLCFRPRESSSHGSPFSVHPLREIDNIFVLFTLCTLLNLCMLLFLFFVCHIDCVC